LFGEILDSLLSAFSNYEMKLPDTIVSADSSTEAVQKFGIGKFTRNYEFEILC
jgi:hypothetical protein